MLLDRFLVGGQWQDRAMYAITMPEWRGGGRGGAHAAGAHPAEAEAAGGAEATGSAEAAVGVSTFDAFSKPAPSTSDAAPTTVSFGGGPEEPALGAPVSPQAEDEQQEPLIGETLDDGDTTAFSDDLDDDEADDEASEPQVLTAQIVMEQIEVVQILPREP